LSRPVGGVDVGSFVMALLRVKEMHKKIPLATDDPECLLGRMLLHFHLGVEQHRECQGDHFALTVSLRRDGKEKASMEKSGLGKFVQTALLGANYCTRKPSAADVL
jgi:hypothetical protein